MISVEHHETPTLSRLGPGWATAHHSRVESTQALARDLPAWSAVWADAQTAGRGQAERTFVSDLGGVYLTAVLPYDGDALAAKGFALAVGWSVCMTLRRSGIETARLRWPNDLMVGTAKVGGILVDQGGPSTLLVGIGLNVTNCPWLSDTMLQGIAGRLADATDQGTLPDCEEWVPKLLQAIRLAHQEFGMRRLGGFAALLESCWGEPHDVILEPVRGMTLAATCGRFLGIDVHGAVRLCTGRGVETRVPAHHIHRLREVA